MSIKCIMANDFFIDCVSINNTTTSGDMFVFNMLDTQMHTHRNIDRLKTELTFKEFHLRVTHKVQADIKLLGFEMIDDVEILFGNAKICAYTRDELEALCFQAERNHHGLHMILESQPTLYVPLRILTDDVTDKLLFRPNSDMLLQEFLSKIDVSFRLNADYLVSISDICLIVDILVK